MENKREGASQERQGGDKRRRGAKVLLKDRRMIDREEHLGKNTHVWVLSLAAIVLSKEKDVNRETKLGRE